MPHDARTLPVALRVARKELTLFLASPIAWLFLASFAAISLFTVFWGEAFFARNIADVRPLFEWMPILLILLCSTLTMRMWSEERRAGTLEHVLTQPAPLWSFVLGKFLACLALLVAALVITLPLPVTVGLISDLDWGPVWAGYAATFMLGAAYLAIGLFVSSRTQNQIVSLIGAVFVCGLFYLIGAPVITDLVGQSAGEWLQALGTGARFEAITRGVIDLGDLVYYLSLTATFLVLNIYTLERERWAHTGRASHHRRWKAVTLLLVLNALASNLWLGQFKQLRLDTTRGQQYTLSEATRTYLSQLQEPLTLRGYFSAKTHPLLSPLVPQMRDLLREYEVAGDGRVRVEFIDPQANPEAEEEANQQYGIEPVPFQVADRYQSSIVSSYFDVLVQYGDEFETLGFQQLIDVKSRGETDLDVQLRNPEYDLTRSIRQVMTEFQSAGNVFDSIDSGVTLTAYVSADERLPPELQSFKASVRSVADALAADSGDKLRVEFIDPDANGGEIASQLASDYGIRPMSAGLFSTEQFHFHLLLQSRDQVVQIPLDDLSEARFREHLDTGLKRFAKGFTRTVAFVGPPVEGDMNAMGQPMPGGDDFSQLQEFLRSELEVVPEDLADGRVSPQADILVLAAPESLDEKAVFAVDQFLMQGGTVIVASSPFSATLSRTSIDLAPQDSGLGPWLEHNGFEIGNTLVLDPQNAAFPIPVSRTVGGMQLQELRMLDYPWFIDIRRNGMSDESPVAADLGQLTMAWASPLTLNEADQGERDTHVLLQSSPGAWTSDSTDIMPRVTDDGVSGWAAEGDTGRQVLAATSQGRFESYFAGKPSPLATTDSPASSSGAGDVATDSADAVDLLSPDGAETNLLNPEGTPDDSDDEAPAEPTLSESLDRVIERSPESARLMVFASNDFLRNSINQLSGSTQGSAYLAPYQLMANAIDASLDDSGLNSIRGRGQFNRTLPPMDRSRQQLWEILNYVLAAVGIGALYGVWRLQRRRREQQQLQWLAS